MVFSFFGFVGWVLFNGIPLKEARRHDVKLQV